MADSNVPGLKVGDTIVLKKVVGRNQYSDRTFGEKGDKCVIESIDADGDIWADFNNQGNPEVFGNGHWCIYQKGYEEGCI